MTILYGLKNKDSIQTLDEGFYLVRLMAPYTGDLVDNDLHNDLHSEEEEGNIVWYPAVVYMSGDSKDISVMGWDWSNDQITPAENYIVTHAKKLKLKQTFSEIKEKGYDFILI